MYSSAFQNKRNTIRWENKIYKNIKRNMKCRIATYTTGKVFYMNEQLLKTLRDRNSNFKKLPKLKMSFKTFKHPSQLSAQT